MNSQSVVANAAVAGGGRVMNALVGVVVTAFIFRWLGATEYGQYVVVLSVGAILQMLADSGLYLTLTRLIATDPDRARQHISHIIWLRWMIFALVFGGSLIVVGIMPAWRGWWWWLLIAAAGLWFQSFSQLLMGIYQARGVVWRATVGDLIGRMVQLGIIVLILKNSLTVVGALAAFAGSSALAWGLHYWLLPMRGIVTAPNRASWLAWGRAVRDSWPLGLILVLNAVYFRIDAMMLSWLRPGTEVGFYGVAYGVMERILFFPAMLGGLLLPRLAGALAGREVSQAAAWIRQGLQLMLLAAAALLAIGIPLAPEAMRLIIGQLSSAGQLLQVLLVALAAMFAGNIFGFSLVAAGRQRTLVVLYAGLVVFNVIANLLFIPAWGATAAAWVTVATELLSAGVAGVVVYRQLAWSLSWGWLARVALVAGLVLALLIVMPVHWHVIPRAAAAGLVYVGAAWVLGLLDRRQYTLLYAGL